MVVYDYDVDTLSAKYTYPNSYCISETHRIVIKCRLTQWQKHIKPFNLIIHLSNLTILLVVHYQLMVYNVPAVTPSRCVPSSHSGSENMK